MPRVAATAAQGCRPAVEMHTDEFLVFFFLRTQVQGLALLFWSLCSPTRGSSHALFAACCHVVGMLVSSLLVAYLLPRVGSRPVETRRSAESLRCIIVVLLSLRFPNHRVIKCTAHAGESMLRRTGRCLEDEPDKRHREQLFQDFHRRLTSCSPNLDSCDLQVCPRCEHSSSTTSFFFPL